MKIIITKSDIVYIDMDGVLVQKNGSINFKQGRLKQGFFLHKEPIDGAIEAFKLIAQHCDVYILSTPVWDNEYCWSEKRIWVEKHLGCQARKRLILTHNKSLNVGKILIDDSLDHGVSEFKGIHLHFETNEFPDWKSILNVISFQD